MGFDRRLLVTGAKGQLGRALARLVPAGVFLDRNSLDVTDREAVFRAIEHFGPEVIIHAAAYTGVDAAEADPEGAQLLNVEATRWVAEASRKFGSMMIYPSTDYVFSGEKLFPYREEDETRPLSVYGRTKLEGEDATKGAGIYLVVRTSWVFGEGTNFVRSIVKAAESQRELTIVDDQVGLPTYARDLAAGILALTSAGANGTYHLAGGGEPASWADLAEAALDLVKSGAAVRRVATSDYYSSREGPVAPRPGYSVLDCSKAAEFGVRLRPWPEALAEYLKEES